MVGPAAAAPVPALRRRLPRLRIALAILLALAQTWLGIALAFFTDWPPMLLDRVPQLPCLCGKRPGDAVLAHPEIGLTPRIQNPSSAV